MLMIDSDMVKMPGCCGECFACYGGLCFVAPSDSDGTCPAEGGRAEWCPLKEVDDAVSRFDKH